MKKISKNRRKKKSKISKKDYLQISFGDTVSMITESRKHVIILDR